MDAVLVYPLAETLAILLAENGVWQFHREIEEF